jgi:hypothetical protein
MSTTPELIEQINFGGLGGRIFSRFQVVGGRLAFPHLLHREIGTGVSALAPQLPGAIPTLRACFAAPSPAPDNWTPTGHTAQTVTGRVTRA